MELDAHSSHIKFTPNSKFILASTQDSTIRLWNVQTSRCVKTYTGHTNRTYSIFADLAPGAKHIVSGSEDYKVYLWNLQKRQVVQVLEGHRGEIVTEYIRSIESSHVFIRCCHRHCREFIMFLHCYLLTVEDRAIPLALSSHLRRWRKTLRLGYGTTTTHKTVDTVVYRRQYFTRII